MQNLFPRPLLLPDQGAPFPPSMFTVLQVPLTPSLAASPPPPPFPPSMAAVLQVPLSPSLSTSPPPPPSPVCLCPWSPPPCSPHPGPEPQSSDSTFPNSTALLLPQARGGCHRGWFALGQASYCACFAFSGSNCHISFLIKLHRPLPQAASAEARRALWGRDSDSPGLGGGGAPQPGKTSDPFPRSEPLMNFLLPGETV